MLIYFDESYDNEHQYLLLGALFNPHPKFLHRKLSELKKKYNYFSHKFKNQVREHLISKIEVKNLLPESWHKYSKTYVEEYWPKFNIWYWKPI